MVRIEKSFFSKLIEKSETNKYNRKKWLSLCKTFLFTFIFSKKWLFLEILQKFWNFLNFQIFVWPRLFQQCSRSPKNSFYKKTITHVPTKNYWKWPKFLSNFSIFDRNFEFFGQNFFSQIFHPKTFLCAKNQVPIFKTRFFIDFYWFWSKMANFGWAPLLWGPCPGPPIIRSCPEKTS